MNSFSIRTPLSCLAMVLIVLFVSATAGAMEITSNAFENDSDIPIYYTGAGSNISPALHWTGAPETTKSFVLIVDDPDAPSGDWVHWVLYDIPGNALGLRANMPRNIIRGDRSKQGTNSFGKIGYDGPSPPPGPAHRYFFRLYALDSPLEVAPGATKNQVLNAAQGHILAEAQLMGRFGR